MPSSLTYRVLAIGRVLRTTLLSAKYSRALTRRHSHSVLRRSLSIYLGTVYYSYEIVPPWLGDQVVVLCSGSSMIDAS